MVKLIRPQASGLGPQTHRPVPRTEDRGPRTGSGGFTLIELMVVITIIGILAGIAVVNVKYAQRKAREAALKKDLHDMREAIDNFYADKQRFPSDLNELVPKYLKRIPADPISGTPNWEPIMSQPDADAPESTDASGAAAAPGVEDVKSKAPGSTLENVPYSEL